MSDEIDLSVTLEQYLRVFRQPELTRGQLESLYESVELFLDEIIPRAGEILPQGDLNQESVSLALQLERALEHALAERDAADREYERRVEIRGRMVAALDTLDDFMRQMPVLAKREIAIGTAALDEGFELRDGGAVRIAPAQDESDPGALELRRADLEEQFTAAVAARGELMRSTIETLRDRLGFSADGTGIPWVLRELATSGLDVAEPFAGTASILPECALKDLLRQIIADVELARTAAEFDESESDFDESEND
ncbi:hypothetical protein [Nocardia alni]|uniref:hypothetical protein n=1 Tax=Nocardia alni TaxID=2815723 RepID=UPI001C22EF52|nr:hypothetical protein [Nocardia alni]